jgi:hypothetical protein
MKLLTPLVALALTSLAVAEIGSPDIQQQAIVGTDSKVPGNSPLKFCTEEHDIDILQLEYINIDPIVPIR